MQRYPKYQAALLKLGNSWDVDEDLYAELEEFTCALYGRVGSKDIDKLKYMLLKKKCKSSEDKIKLSKNIDFSKLPLPNLVNIRHNMLCIFKKWWFWCPTLPQSVLKLS